MNPVRRVFTRNIAGATLASSLLLAAAQASAQCLVSGPSSVCPDSSAQLCASGSSWQWTGPNGFTATTRCIDVSQPGTYSVRVFDNLNGLWFGPCTWTLAQRPADSCGVAPPPPPPPIDSTNCPRSASFWARAGRPRGQFSSAQMAALGSCVDARSALFAWADPAAGILALMSDNNHLGLRGAALREYGAVLVNVCAQRESLVSAGRRIGLCTEARFAMRGGVPTSVANWISDTETRLLALQGASNRDRAARAVWSEIALAGWAMTHGLGMHVTCFDQPRLSLADAMADPTLAPALAEPVAPAGAVFTAPSPNPFRGSTQFAVAVDDAAGADVDVAVFDLSGRRTATLANGHLDAGSHTLAWDGRASDGSRAHPGVYFVRGRVGAQVLSRSIMLTP